MFKILKLINKFSIYLSSVFLGVMVVAIFYQVIARYFFNNPPAWTEELSRYLQIWLVCLMVGPLILSSEHIEIDVVYNMIPKKSKRTFNLIRHTANLIFALILFYLGMKLNMLKKPQISPALEISMGWVYWSVPAMLVLIVTNQIAVILMTWNKSEDISA
jgi:TRAP-type C4-dicarboxylate transport system permease small subunit